MDDFCNMKRCEKESCEFKYDALFINFRCEGKSDEYAVAERIWNIKERKVCSYIKGI